ncbi:MAG: MFS transporter [Parachlamydia sp.]|jgi:EmrB/QacA subfamily drug resistance transporter|nr:MFS transporter [Parachlamydia sp.]
MEKSSQYGRRLAIIYALVWFIDLLDASSLNIALPSIAHFFHIETMDAEWAIVGFLLSMTLGISISGWLGEAYGTRSIFLLSQIGYLLSSIGCGTAPSIYILIFFRLMQGFSAGMAIPLGLAALLKALPEKQWAKTIAAMNMITLVAPALGPLFGAYMTQLFGWASIFLMKLPLSGAALLLSIKWLKKEEKVEKLPFDGMGFILGSVSLLGILWVLSEAGKKDALILLTVALFSLLFGIIFIKAEKNSSAPLIPLGVFKIGHFTYGNLIQSASNTIFLGANFVIGFYLQKGLGRDLVTTGWIMAAITPGMMVVQPLIGKFYNKVGPLPFIISGLTLLAGSTFAFALTTPATSSMVLGTLVFCIGAASATQAANVSAIFSSLPPSYKGAGSTLYALFKQVSASFGVALSTMVLAFGTNEGIPSLAAFQACFVILGCIPLMALLLCYQINNKEAIRQIQ